MRAAGHLDPVRAGADGLGDGPGGIECVAQLVEVGGFEIRAEPHRSAVGRECAEDQPQQRRLAGAVFADQREPIAAHHTQVQSVDHGPIAETFADFGQLGDQLAGALAGVERQLEVADALAPRRAFAAEPLEAHDAAGVARASRFDALAYPRLFLRPEAVELARGGLLGRQFGRASAFPRTVIAGIRAQKSAIEFDDAGSHAIEKRTIVGDHDQCRSAQQQVFEQRDAVDVEMICGLVE